MSHTHYYVKRPLPLITPRIEFHLSSRPALPAITPRIEFNFEQPHRRVTFASGIEGSHTTISTNTASTSNNPPSTSNTASNLNNPTSTSTAPPSPTRMIPKPSGEPGRPKSGGFSLESTLKDVHRWSEKDVDDLMLLVRKEANRRLDITACYRNQRKDALKAICDTATSRFPLLKNYEECWPVLSAIKLTCKYRSETHRRKKTRKTTERVQAAVSGGTSKKKKRQMSEDSSSSSSSSGSDSDSEG